MYKYKLSFWGVIVLFSVTACGISVQEKPYYMTERLVKLCSDSFDREFELWCVLDTVGGILKISVYNNLGLDITCNPPYPPYLRVSIREYGGPEEWIPRHTKPDEKGKDISPFVVPAHGYLYLEAPLVSYGYYLNRFDEKKEYVWRVDYNLCGDRVVKVANRVILGPIDKRPLCESTAIFWVFDQNEVWTHIHIMVGMEPQ
ncbi:MAG: hypothetical protein ACFFCW_39025 [Candidatus Hodarchaeota archaeon]